MPDYRDLCTVIEFAAKHLAPIANAAVEPVLVNGSGTQDFAKQLVVDSIYVGGDAAGTLQLLDDTNTAIAGYFFAFGAGVPIQLSRLFLKKCPPGRGLRYTTTGGGNHAVQLKYHIDSINITQ